MEEFLKQLKSYLHGLPESERNEIVRDHEEMIRDAMASGKSEIDAVQAFGDPRTLARSLTATSLVSPSKTSDQPRSTWSEFRHVGRATLAVAALAPFNIIFVLGPYLAIVGCLVAGWSVAGAAVATCLAIFAAVANETVTHFTSVWAALSGTLLCLGGLCFGLAGCTFMAWITAIFAKLTLGYLKWNLSLVAPQLSEKAART